jgi:hypothetical protein
MRLWLCEGGRRGELAAVALNLGQLARRPKESARGSRDAPASGLWTSYATRYLDRSDGEDAAFFLRGCTRPSELVSTTSASTSLLPLHRYGSPG